VRRSEGSEGSDTGKYLFDIDLYGMVVLRSLQVVEEGKNSSGLMISINTFEVEAHLVQTFGDRNLS
jgi:hypothetical protein